MPLNLITSDQKQKYGSFEHILQKYRALCLMEPWGQDTGNRDSSGLVVLEIPCSLFWGIPEVIHGKMCILALPTRTVFFNFKSLGIILNSFMTKDAI